MNDIDHDFDIFEPWYSLLLMDENTKAKEAPQILVDFCKSVAPKILKAEGIWHHLNAREERDLNREMQNREDAYDPWQNPEEIAKQKSLIVVYPKDDEIQIDIDSDTQYKEYKRRVEDFQCYADSTNILIHEIKESPSASGNPERKHVTIKFRRAISMEERLILQAAFNDDTFRVFLNAVRFFSGEKNPTRFFEKPNEPEQKKKEDEIPW